MSLRARLALLFFLITGIGIGLVSILAFRSTSTELGTETDQFVRNRATEVAQGLREPPRGGRGGRGGDQPDNPSPLAFDPDAIVQTIDANGEITGSSSTADIPISAVDLQLAAADTGGENGRIESAFQNIEVDGVRYRLYTRSLADGGAVQVARATSEADRVLDSLRNQFLLIGLLMAGLAGVAGWIVARQTTKPLRQLSAAAGQVASTQDFDTPIGIDRSDEVGALARSFQEMLDALATSREQQHRLVLDAGHELRTPLTSIRANVAMLERADSMSAEDRTELLGAVNAELRELNELFSELIELATDSQDAEPHRHLELLGVVEHAVARLDRRSNRVIEVRGDDAMVLGDATLIERAVSNLLGNAHKFSPPNTPIHVVVDQGRVAVRDEGPGISVDERDRVFDRFYRTDATRAMTGSGLGLAIVAQIARNHGGHVWAADNPLGVGAEVGFAIPVSDPTAASLV